MTDEAKLALVVLAAQYVDLPVAWDLVDDVTADGPSDLRVLAETVRERAASAAYRI